LLKQFIYSFNIIRFAAAVIAVTVTAVTAAVYFSQVK
jgi:hypothetical protein